MQSYIIELSPPRINADNLGEQINTFTKRYSEIVDAGMIVSIPDNPMASSRMTALEMVFELGSSFNADKTIMHMTTYHYKQQIDSRLAVAYERGLRNLLVVTGDYNPYTHKLNPHEIESSSESVTSVDLIRYIRSLCSGIFNCGVAYNQYNDIQEEDEKLLRKFDAGASFVVTQPAVADDVESSAIQMINGDVFIGVWMSHDTNLLKKIIRQSILTKDEYDPDKNLRDLINRFPRSGFYLMFLDVNRPLPSLPTLA